MYFGNYNFFKLNRILHFIRKLLLVIIVCSFILCVISIIVNYTNSTGNNISEGIVRLHVIPNSNSNKDQELKLMVRDAVIKHLKENTAEDIKDAESMFSWINADLDNIKEVAENVVQSNGYTYKINTVPGTFLFPQKNYGKFSLPAGDYRALRIVIGEGIGNNWFCILFPPLCFTGTAVSYDAPKENTLKIISDTNDEESSGVKIKFKIAEFFGRIHNLLNSRINISKKK